MRNVGKGTLRCKCILINWKYVTVGDGCLEFNIENMCVVREYWDVYVEFFFE
jgi:hypothetical protein